MPQCSRLTVVSPTEPPPAESLPTTDGEESTESLLLRVGRREVDALDALYARLGRLAFSVAYRVLNDQEAAEDVVQEAFLSVWRRAESYQPERASARTWLLTVVRYRAIDVARARAARPYASSLDDALALAGPDGDPADDALGRIDAEGVRAAVLNLPTDQRTTVELAFFGGLSYPEIAVRMGAPLGTVKSRMRLALERLRGILAEAQADGQAPTSRRSSQRAGILSHSSASPTDSPRSHGVA